MLEQSTEDCMLYLFEQGRAERTCAIVIDMQAKPAGRLECAELRYNDDTVVENQARVREAAVEYGMHVIADKYTKDGKVKVPYVEGLLDRGIDVVVSRATLASSDGAPLDGEYQMCG